MDPEWLGRQWSPLRRVMMLGMLSDILLGNTIKRLLSPLLPKSKQREALIEFVRAFIRKRRAEIKNEIEGDRDADREEITESKHAKKTRDTDLLASYLRQDIADGQDSTDSIIGDCMAFLLAGILRCFDVRVLLFVYGV